jgi:hypothetical protein
MLRKGVKMKKIKYVLFIMTLLLLLPLTVKAEDKTIATNFGPGPVTNAENTYFFDSTISKDITIINHNAFVAGSTVNIKASEINGLVFGAGNTINVESTIDYGFLAGNMININNTTNNDLFLAGNMINITKDAQVKRDLYLAANSIAIDTDVAGRIYAAANEITLEDITINGNAYIAASKINIVGKVTINGSLNYNSGTTIVGKKNLDVDQINITKVEKDNTLSKIYSTIINIISLILIAVIINLLLPNIYKNIDKKIASNKVLKDLGVGLLAFIVVPIIAIILAFTVVGIPLTFITLAIYVITAYLCTITSSILLGNLINTKLFKQDDNFYLNAIMGIIIVQLLSLIPYVGSLIELFFSLTGFGIITLMFITEIKKEHPKKS